MTRDIANQHWSNGFNQLVADLGGEFRKFGSVDAFLGNLPLPFANGCLVLAETQQRDLEDAISWVESGRVPFQVRVDESVVDANVMAVADDHGLLEDETPMPAMVLTPIPVSRQRGPGVSVARVTSDVYADFVSIMAASGVPAEFATQIFPPRLIDTEYGAYFLASLDGERAGISVAVRTGDSGGIYSVATLEAARRHGVGSAVTWAAVDTIRDWGCAAAVLQSSEMGYSVYEAMGFREVTRYRRFSPIIDTAT